MFRSSMQGISSKCKTHTATKAGKTSPTLYNNCSKYMCKGLSSQTADKKEKVCPKIGNPCTDCTQCCRTTLQCTYIHVIQEWYVYRCAPSKRAASVLDNMHAAPVEADQQRGVTLASDKWLCRVQRLYNVYTATTCTFLLWKSTSFPLIIRATIRFCSLTSDSIL